MSELTVNVYDPDPKFACPCCGVNWIDPRIGYIVAEIERWCPRKLVITSGYRCKKHNRAVGGSKTSSHLRGLAVDIACPDSRTRFHILSAAFASHVHRVGIYRFFIHLDIDRQKDPKVIWYG